MQSQMPEAALVSISDQIDLEYHDEGLLLNYYDLTYSLNALSKKRWFTDLEDITTSKSTQPELVDIQHKYRRKKVLRDRIEAKLTQSKI